MITGRSAAEDEEVEGCGLVRRYLSGKEKNRKSLISVYLCYTVLHATLIVKLS
jgi:hypothetical protein